ncbi:MAG TPA: hypothetical protein PK733_04780 [Clostridiales bacterium]|nr:hypothetical protein [Clostridiales bacterium]
MDDDLGKTIKQITDMLSKDKDKMPDNLMGLISLLTSPGSSESGSENDVEREEKNEKEGNNVNRSNKGDLQDNLEMIKQVTKIMDRLNTKNDPRVNLLNALRPFLNNKRQKKINNCIMLLQVTGIMKAMDE